MRAGCVPVPAALATLRRDDRGVLVPVTVSWKDGLPQFAKISPSRIVLLATHHLCGVCGRVMPKAEPYWVAAVDEGVGDAHEIRVFDRATQSLPGELGGHRECIIYAAVACPFLAHTTSRRRAADYPSLGATLPKGTSRGEHVVLAGYRRWEYAADVDGLWLHAAEKCEAISYQDGADLRDVLSHAIAKSPVRRAPDFSVQLWRSDLARSELARQAGTAFARVSAGQQFPLAVGPSVGRNETCPCGSGAKYKHCHAR